MSYFLSILITCETTELAEDIFNLLSRDTRPIFDDEIEGVNLAYYNSIAAVEYPDEIKLIGAKLLIIWVDKDGICFNDLAKFLNMNSVTLDLAFEIGSYADTGDTPDQDMNGSYITNVAGKQQYFSKLDLRDNSYRDLLDRAMRKWLL